MDVRTEKIGSEEIGEKQERDWNGMKYWLLLKSIDLKRITGILVLGLCILLTACKREEKTVRNEREGYTAEGMNPQNGVEIDAAEEEYLEKKKFYSEIKHAEMKPSIDYEFIETKHKILKHNICTSPKSDYDNTILEEYLREDVEEDAEMIGELGSGSPLTIDYFPYDFNMNGLEDYLVCYYGSLWCGSGGNTVMIYTQEGDGSLRKILDITVRLHEPDLPDGHAPIAVLDEMTDGYYGIVLPGSNRILRYDKEKDWYEFETEIIAIPKD